MNQQIPENNLILPLEEKKLLLHCCCAPCSGAIIQRLKTANIQCAIIYYNPNIYPPEEYEKRKKEQQRYAKKLKIEMVDLDYDADKWLRHVAGLENEPERGERCSACFQMRFERVAQYASKNNFKVFSSTLGLSRWKDFDQVCAAGKWAANQYPGLTYWDYNWRKKGGAQLASQISKEENFYKQTYCGCIFSYQNNKPKLS